MLKPTIMSITCLLHTKLSEIELNYVEILHIMYTNKVMEYLAILGVKS